MRFDRQIKLTFSTLAGLSLVTAVLAFGSILYLNQSYRTLIESNSPLIASTSSLSVSLEQVAQLSRDFSLARSETEVLGLGRKLNREVNQVRQELLALSEQDNAHLSISDIQSAADILIKETETLMGLSETIAKTDDQLRDLSNDSLQALDHLRGVGDNLVSNARVALSLNMTSLYQPQSDEKKTESLDKLVDEDFFLLERMGEFRQSAIDLSGLIQNLLRIKGQNEIERFLPEIRNQLDRMKVRIPLIQDVDWAVQVNERFAKLQTILDDEGFPATYEKLFSLRQDALDASKSISINSLSLSRKLSQLIVQSQEATERRQTSVSDRLKWTLFGFLLLSLGVIGGAGITLTFANQRIVARLRDIASGIVALARNDFSRKIRRRSGDDLGRLERAVEILNGKVKHNHSLKLELQASKRELEDKVEERTRQFLEQARESDHARAHAEEATRSKSEFLAMMSHEIRTPLNGVIGMLRLLEEEVDKTAGKRLKMVRQSAQDLLDIANDLLDYERFGQSRVNLNLIHFDIRAFIEQVVSLAGADAQEKHLSMDVSVSPLVPDILLGDASKLRQILINLLSNAVKYTEEGGVHLFVDMRYTDDGRDLLVIFRVEDSGIGIASDQLEHIFDAYEHSPEAHKGKRYSAGLGLTVCRRLTELLSGILTVESEPGEGSSFQLIVPMQLGEVSEIQSAQPEDRGYALDLNILLVEDHSVSRLVAKSYLEHMQCDVVEAADGMSALKAFEKGSFDAVLMDLDLPDWTGVETTKRMIQKASEAGSEQDLPRFVAVTAHEMRDMDALQQAGISHFVQKPIAPSDLVAALQDLAEAGDVMLPDAEAMEVTEQGASQRDDIRRRLEEDMRYMGADNVAAILSEFLAKTPDDLTHLIAAMEQQEDLAQVAHLAHRLRGSLSNFALSEAMGLLAWLEDQAKAGELDLSQADELTKLLEVALQDLMEVAQELGLHINEAGD
ncbi:ATP-binding protein [Cohaesibacter gelatinilyticus]|uniref:ATP-binding protein n=1 Tax=Cohaesibacter gelatinilyticus TaxID=372072 RepID=UPI00148268A6|nr:ATP-binding protein [Cohaesibacter gelatinilyticus]